MLNCDHSVRHAQGQEIHILHQFRDEYLLTNPLGRALVDIYYRIGPPMAEGINAHPSLKLIVRAGPVCVVVISTVVINTTPAEKTAMVVLVVLILVALEVWITRR